MCVSACAGQRMSVLYVYRIDVALSKENLVLFRHCHLFNPLKPELNPICYLLALLVHHFLHVSSIRVKSLTLRLLMSYIYIWSTHS